MLASLLTQGGLISEDYVCEQMALAAHWVWSVNIDYQETDTAPNFLIFKSVCYLQHLAKNTEKYIS